MILQGKVALVTGGTSGIGRATAIAFVEPYLSLAVASEVMRLYYEQGSELTVFTDSNTEDFYEYEDYA